MPDSAEFKVNQQAELAKLARESMLTKKIGAGIGNLFAANAKGLAAKMSGKISGRSNAETEDSERPKEAMSETMKKARK